MSDNKPAAPAMPTDPNHDIVPTLRMFDGVMTGLAADEIERLRKRTHELEDLLRSACCIAERKGERTAWERFEASIRNLGLNPITARTYRILPSDEESGSTGA